MNKEKIIAHFGVAFYTKLINDLKKYSQLWKLYEFEQIDYYSINSIFKCVSAYHGLCVLKIGNSSDETKNEYNALKEYNGRRFCKVYEADIENGVLLIECITPGIQLRAESALDKRLDMFCDLFCGLHIKPIDSMIYPTYMDWVCQITEYMKNCESHKDLYKKMVQAKEICCSLWEKYNNKMLLHGDLHHDNILLGEDDHYRIIDPKGVIGDVVFDIPRFILNEFDDILDDSFYRKFVHITKTLSKKLKIPEYDIRRLTYVEMCMANCWCVESKQEPNINEVLFTEKLI